jgi:hypothetical protein
MGVKTFKDVIPEKVYKWTDVGRRDGKKFWMEEKKYLECRYPYSTRYSTIQQQINLGLYD